MAAVQVFDPMWCQAPKPSPAELSPEELQTVALFQENTPSVVNIANIGMVSCLHHCTCFHALLSFHCEQWTLKACARAIFGDERHHALLGP